MFVFCHSSPLHDIVWDFGGNGYGKVNQPLATTFADAIIHYLCIEKKKKEINLPDFIILWVIYAFYTKKNIFSKINSNVPVKELKKRKPHSDLSELFLIEYLSDASKIF